MIVITITEENILEGRKGKKVYQKFFENYNSGKKHFSFLKKKLAEKGYNFVSSGSNSYCGDCDMWYMFDNDNMDEITLSLEDFLPLYTNIDGKKWHLSNSYGGGAWNSREEAFKEIMKDNKYTFDIFFKR